jgi:hypothetical protein
MPLHNVDAMDAAHKESAHHEKIAKQVADTRERAKLRIPKSIVKRFNAQQARAPPPPKPEPSVPLDPVTELNVKLGTKSVVYSALSLPIADEKRLTLRCNLEQNQFISGFIDRRITATILDFVTQGADELRFAFNYSTEYLKAVQGRSSESANFTRPSRVVEVGEPGETLPQH